MCTITVVPHERGVRLVFNRDERRTRLAGVPPQIHDLSGRHALFPVDPQGGGTWVGVNDSGVVAALLNLRPTRPAARGPRQRSRGLIVLELLRCTSLEQAIAVATALDADLFEPFRAVVVHHGHLAAATWRGTGSIHSTLRSLDAPALFTSSSLGDAVAGRPRRQLFERMVLRGSAGWLNGQARYHDHQWPRRPGISVRMERHDALTVSRTQIEVTNHTRRLLYEAPLQTRGTAQVRQCCSLH
jgi:hypothetical protein